ncbi:hypothetical protein Tco_1316819 [Tanacetum coccineum]
METKDTLSSCSNSEEQQMHNSDRAKKDDALADDADIRPIYDEEPMVEEKGFAIAALKNELRKLTGNSVNTKFAKSSILGKPALQPRRNQSVVRQPTAFKSERPSFSSNVCAPKNSRIIHDHSNELSRSKLVQRFVPPADKTDTSRQELELLFHHHITMLRTFRVILFSIHNDEWKSFQCHHQTALRSYALSWKPCQGDSLNLPDHSFQDDAKYEHVGQDTRSQSGKDDQDKQGKDLKISDIKTKSKDNDKGSRSKITKHEGTSLQRIQIPRPQDLNDKSNLIDLMKECHNELTSGEIVSLKILSRTMEVRS